MFKARHAMEALGRLVEGNRFGQENEVAVIFADIFRLKTPHDNYGHQPIDDALVEVGNSIKAVAREGEIAARYGGDEFLLILPDVTESEARQRAEELRAEVEKIRVVFNGEPRENLRVSVGVAHLSSLYGARPPHSRLHGAEALMRNADADLECDRTRNAARVCSPDSSQAASS